MCKKYTFCVKNTPFFKMYKKYTFCVKKQICVKKYMFLKLCKKYISCVKIYMMYFFTQNQKIATCIFLHKICIFYTYTPRGKIKKKSIKAH